MKAMANTTRKKAFDSYKSRIGEWAPVSLALALVGASCAALSFLGSLWILLGIALIFLPTLFASTQYFGSSISGKEADTRIITKGFAAYFRVPCIGVYRFFLNGFLAFVCSMGTAFFLFLSIYTIALETDPNFAAAAESITAAIASGDSEGAASAIAQTPMFQTMYDVSEFALGFGLVFFFWLFMGKYVQNGILRNAFHLDNPRLANFYYGYYRRAVGRDWRKARSPFLAFPIAFFLIGLVTTLVCYFLRVPVKMSLFFGLLAFALLLSIYLPLGLYLHIHFSYEHEKAIAVAFYEGSKKIYYNFATSGRASEEELERMREELEKMKPSSDEEKE